MLWIRVGDHFVGSGRSGWYQLKCWMFSFEDWRLFLLLGRPSWRRRDKKLRFFIRTNLIFFTCKFYNLDHQSQCCEQCCRSIMIYRGSGSGQYLAQLSKDLKFVQNLAFQCQEHYNFRESWPRIFDYLIFVIFYVGSESKSGAETVIHPGSGFTPFNLRIRNSIPDPGSKRHLCFSFLKYDPGCWFRIPYLDFFHPGSLGQKALDLQHWSKPCGRLDLKCSILFPHRNQTNADPQHWNAVILYAV